MTLRNLNSKSNSTQKAGNSAFINVGKQMIKLLKCMIKYRRKTFRKFLLFIILKYVHSLRVFKVSESKVSTGQISTIFVKNRGQVESGRSITLKMDGLRDWTIYIGRSTLSMSQNSWFCKILNDEMQNDLVAVRCSFRKIIFDFTVHTLSIKRTESSRLWFHLEG